MADTTTIVVLVALQQQAENAAITADPAGGAGTFVPGSGLRAAGDETGAIHVLYCVWNMKPGQQAAFATALGGPVNIYTAGQMVHLNRDRWMFNNTGGAWPLHEVFAALGLDYLPPRD